MHILNGNISVNEDWTAEIIPDATIELLDKDAIKKARENFITKFPHLSDQEKDWDDSTFLDKAKLTVNKKRSHDL